MSKPKIQTREDRENESLRVVMSTVHGRRTVWKFLSMCGTYQNPARFESVEETFFLCGKQDLGQRLLLDIMKAAPEFYEAMKKEASDVPAVQATDDDDDKSIFGDDDE